jgi:tRNA A37 threonylcarbamoyladenosine modification protein TsaB
MSEFLPEKISIGLIIDTSTALAYLALTKQGCVIEQPLPLEGRNLSKLLLPALSHLDVSNVNYIGIGVGPGAFTGTRIGVSAAIGLSFSLGIPLVSFSSKLVPNLDEIGQLCYQKYLTQEFDSQIELVYFSTTS